MLAFYVLLSVFLTNSICRSVSAQRSFHTENYGVLRTLPRTGRQRSVPIPRAGSDLLGDNSDTHSIRKRASSVTTSGHRTPLVEVMLRILLNTIQLVPKKRATRAVRPMKKKLLSPTRQTMPVPVVLNSLDPDKAPAFFNTGSQPLMVSSLEHTLDDDSGEWHSIQDTQSFETVESSSNESAIPDNNETDEEASKSAEDSDEKLYDLLLKILKVLDDQAYREAERNRRLEHLRNPSAVAHLREFNSDDNSLEPTDE